MINTLNEVLDRVRVYGPEVVAFVIPFLVDDEKLVEIMSFQDCDLPKDQSWVSTIYELEIYLYAADNNFIVDSHVIRPDHRKHFGQEYCTRDHWTYYGIEKTKITVGLQNGTLQMIYIISLGKSALQVEFYQDSSSVMISQNQFWRVKATSKEDADEIFCTLRSLI